MLLDLLGKATDVEKDDKGQMEFVAKYKKNAYKSCLSIQLFTPGGIRSRSAAGDCRYFVGKFKDLLQF